MLVRKQMNATFIHFQWGQNGTIALENSLAVSEKLNIYLPYGPAIPPLDIFPREMKTFVLRNVCSSFICNRLKLGTTHISQQLNSLIMVYQYNGMLLSNKKRLLILATTQMNLKIIITCNRIEEGCILYDPIHMKSQKIQTN